MDSCLNAIKQAQYTIHLGQRPILINIVRMKESLILWIGSPFNTSFTNLSVSINNVVGIPSTSVLLSSIYHLIDITNRS